MTAVLGRPGFRARQEDANSVTLTGAVARTPILFGHTVEFTVAGKIRLPSGKILPFYHKVRAGTDHSVHLEAGDVVTVSGTLDHHKYGVGDGQRSLIRVVATQMRSVDAPEPVLCLQDPDHSGKSFILDGGENVVTLSGNLTRAAEAFTAPSGDPYVRLSLAVRGLDRAHYFTLKAWREQATLLQDLQSGARLGGGGVLISESFRDAQDQKRNAVTVEVINRGSGRGRHAPAPGGCGACRIQEHQNPASPRDPDHCGRLAGA